MTAPIDEFTDPPRGPEEPRRQIAVALAHQFGSDGAPEVVASGHGAVAEQILEIAFAAGVKVRTDPDLASLLSLVEVGEEIPAEAFVASLPPERVAIWDALAHCESTSRWDINTGNGFYGGIQFTLSSWRAVGGTGYPHEHSREEQIYRGELLLEIQGWRAWPGCTRKLGLR